MDVYQSMRNWAKQYNPFGGAASSTPGNPPGSPGMDTLNQMQGLGMDTKPQQAWSGAQPGQVQMGGQTIGIPRQPWGFGAMPEAVAESAPVQQALASDETAKEINWSALAQLFSQTRQQQKPQASVGHLPTPGRGRQIEVNANYAPAPLDPRLLVNGGRLAPRG
ncbi:hypothetical protein [Azotobacter chroococcum]|uniref:hypothetical protein n=1 Tax=Azotobacter chroococcum TaxID=353 RepID=UPI0010AEB402|nr:hypothetical protein [Azotobacter chroococcum]TKD39935.1 hypothetical protein FCG41_11925 [Azotobacter chroococcum]